MERQEMLKYRIKNLNALVLGAFLLFFACAAPERGKPSRMARPISEPPKTLAIFPFENNSVTDPEKYAPLSNGLSAMLITDLKQIGTSLKLIERSKITALVKEIAMGQSGMIDQSTAVQAGRILGAQSIAFGSFMVLGSKVRIDARIIKVETSEVLMAESITGASHGFLELERELARKIASSLKVTIASRISSIAHSEKGRLEAAVSFARGVEALDDGRREEARKLFDRCIQLDPAYRTQVEGIAGP
jgi:TolB-like protein